MVPSCAAPRLSHELPAIRTQPSRLECRFRYGRKPSPCSAKHPQHTRPDTRGPRQSARLSGCRIGCLSLARMMLFGEGPIAIRRADALHTESQRYYDQSYQPYALTYPVFRALAQGNSRRALRECERGSYHLSGTPRQRDRDRAVGSVSPRLFRGWGGSVDDHIRSAAADAVASGATVYLYSHIFDARETGSCCGHASHGPELPVFR